MKKFEDVKVKTKGKKTKDWGYARVGCAVCDTKVRYVAKTDLGIYVCKSCYEDRLKYLNKCK